MNRRDFINFPILLVSCLSFRLWTNRSGKYEDYNYKEFMCTNMEKSEISLIPSITIIRPSWFKKLQNFNVTLSKVHR